MVVKSIFQDNSRIQLDKLSTFELYELFSKENNWQELAKVDWPKFEKKDENSCFKI